MGVLASTSLTLAGTAAALGGLHTLYGPDHYVPFIALARIGRWSVGKTILVTLSCGLAHVLSSVVLGIIGLVLGTSVLRLGEIESWRGGVAGWMLLAFGMGYTVWGLHRAFRGRRHAHPHRHADGTVHDHEHAHEGDHLHVHAPPFAWPALSGGVKSAGGAPGPLQGEGAVARGPTSGRDGVGNAGPLVADGRSRRASWVMFIIFLFGPCEPLIPLVMYPAFAGRPVDVVWVTLAFAASTLAVMTAMVLLGTRVAREIRVSSLQRFDHAMAGAAIMFCGIAVKTGL